MFCLAFYSSFSGSILNPKTILWTQLSTWCIFLNIKFIRHSFKYKYVNAETIFYIPFWIPNNPFALIKNSTKLNSCLVLKIGSLCVWKRSQISDFLVIVIFIHVRKLHMITQKYFSIKVNRKKMIFENYLLTLLQSFKNTSIFLLPDAIL